MLFVFMELRTPMTAKNGLTFHPCALMASIGEQNLSFCCIDLDCISVVCDCKFLLFG